MPSEFSNCVASCRSILLLSMRLSHITYANQKLFSRISRELASTTEKFVKELSKKKDAENEYDHLLNELAYSTSSAVRGHVLDILKFSKSVIGNPESYMAKQEVNRVFETLSQSLLNLVVTLFLSTKSELYSLSPLNISLLKYAQIISENAVLLQKVPSPRAIAAFGDALNQFVSTATKLNPHGPHSDLIQVAEVFSISNRKKQEATEAGVGKEITSLRDTSRGSSLSKFQRQTKQELVSSIEEVIIESTLHQFSKLGGFQPSGLHFGVSKNLYKIFGYFQALENEISVDHVIEKLSRQIPGFRASFMEHDDPQCILTSLLCAVPTIDPLAYFCVETEVNHNDSLAMEEEISSKDLDVALRATVSKKKQQAPNRRMSMSATVEMPDNGKGAPSLTIGGTKANAAADSKGSRRKRTKNGVKGKTSRSSTKTKFRTFLKKKPSIVGELITAQVNDQAKNSQQLSRFSELQTITDLNELEMGQQTTFNSLTSSIKLIPTIEDLPSLIASFYSSVLLITELAGTPTPEALQKNCAESATLLLTLSKCNMFASGVRIEKLPPSKVEKIEVQLVEKNYVELSKPIDISPDPTWLVGCSTDGWFSVHQQATKLLTEQKMLLCTLSVQIYSLFMTFHKGDISQPTFLYLETCIQRFVENYGILMEEKDRKEPERVVGIPIWEEAATRNKFDVESPKTLTKGSVNSLVEALTDVSVVESDFNSVLFLTYRAYLHPHALLNKLIDRCHVPEMFTRQAGRVQFRCLVAIRELIRSCPQDIDDKMRKVLRNFGEEKDFFAGPAAHDVAKALLHDLDVIEENKKMVQVQNPLFSVASLRKMENVRFLNMDNTKLAESITAVDYFVYSQIKPWELLQTAWTSKKLKYRSVNVINLLQRLNRFTIWVASQIIWPTSLKQRTEVIEKFLKIAQILLQHNNFHSLMGIYAALEISSVARLKFSLVGVKRKLKTFFTEEVEPLFDQSSSWKNYREKLAGICPPAVPYLGIYLTDLVYIEDGNKTLTPDGKINFTKQKLVAKVIRNATQYQSGAYNFTVHPLEFTFTRDLPYMSETALYSLSLKREPRNSLVKDLEP